MKKNRVFNILFLLALYPVSGQESLTPVRFHPPGGKFHQTAPVAMKKNGTPDTLALPFFDDFSRTRIHPDTNKWIDMGAYINSEMASNLISIGVASLDVLDSAGAIYAHARESSFSAETLTSAPIDLDLPVGSNVFLSFFFQPGGKVNPPEKGDSLVLEFKSPLSPLWEKAWSMQGHSADTFRQVILEVSDPLYLTKGFQFRFRNIASMNLIEGLAGLAGNQDIWHIDYVYLDKNRSPADTIYPDVAFVKPLSSLLINYESMPWPHFPAARLVEMGDKLPVVYRNNGDVITNVTRFFEIRNAYNGNLVHSYTGGADNIEPFEVFTYNSNLIYSYASPTSDSARFEVKAYLNTDNPDYKGNDTLKYYQDFFNYYAYDDGSPEAGYVVSGEGTSGAMVAVRFRSYVADTLQAVNIFFNQTYQDAAGKEFSLAVWDDNGGIPGNLIYSQEGLTPAYGDDYPEYRTYLLEEPFIVNGNFHVGWIQSSETGVNVGADLNRDRSDRVFYFIPGNGVWLNTSFDLSLMVRPVLGSSLPLAAKPDPVLPGVDIYPNPASGRLFVQAENPSGIRNMYLMNSYGQMVAAYTGFHHQIDLHPFPPGMYILRIEYRNKQAGHYKLMIIQ